MIFNKDSNYRKIYLIEWQDAHANSGWFTYEEANEFIKQDKCICQEVGWILSETKDEIVLAGRTMQFTNEDRIWGTLHKIPKAWIRKKIIFNLK